MILTGITLFYAGINLGFESRDYTEINSAYWLDACYHYLNELKVYQDKSPAADQENSFQIPLPFNDYASVPDSIVGEEFPANESLLQDSLMLQDTTLASDTVFIDPLSIDSTARLEHFRYKRQDRPYVTLERKKTPAFYARPGAKTRTIEIDSTGNFVIIKEAVAGQQTKIVLRMTMEDYIAMRMALKERETWEDIGYAYELKESKRDLGGLIKDITDFEIPLPSVGVLSIFGDPKISLKIQGAVDIHGAWRTETTEGVTASRFGNTRNEPDFKQQVQINVNGTIGDKLNINADWNTERTFEYENQLKIKYTGYEDEIIQSIEAGNVSLQTSPLVGGSEALFGVKALFKMGPLSLTTLASQKKGEIKEVSVSGGSTSQTFEIRSWNYSENNYFLDELYASTEPDENYFYRYYSTVNHEYDPTIEVVDIEVWKSTFTQVQDKQRERIANAFIDLPGRTTVGGYPDSRRLPLDNPIPGEQETGRFILLTQDVDYKLHPKTGYITLLTSVQELDVIAVAYRVQGATSSPDDDIYFGEFRKQVASDTTRMVLKLVKPKNLQPRFEQAWRLQLRNIYYLGGRDIKPEGFDFKIRYAFEGQGDPVEELVGTDGQQVRLLQAFGLDRYDANGQSNPDGIFDWNSGITVLPQSGEIIFPVLEPFGSDLPENIPDTLAFRNIYEEQKVFAQQNKLKDKWLLTGQYSGSVSSRYNLGFNIVENSVKVILNGQELVQGVDYTVDYNVGQLIIRNDAALVPGANLRITYEQNELFSLASKTMLGARGLFDFSRKTKLGFSLLNLNQQTLQDKVRIGEEPLSNTIYGVDFSTSGDLPFMTKLLDNVISTRQMSGFSLAGEYAYINPDPNTKKSNIASDMNRSIAYIDDFEGSKTIISVGIGYTGWKDISVPDELPFLPDLNKRQLMDFKAKSFWFTQSPSNVQVSQIWGERKRVAKADEYMTIMDYVYIPDTPGTYNYYPNFLEPHRSWGGIMKLLSSVATNLVQENIEFIEFWAQVNTNDPDARIYLDLGRISEDVIPNRELDTEDRNSNDAVDDGEDTGLDRLFDASEGNPAFNNMLTEPVTRPDPSGDNFGFSGNTTTLNIFDYFNINGTEGNAISTDLGRYPDTEDLNRNGQVDLVNSYFRYEVPLDTNPATNPYIAGGGEGYGWYLFRVPVREYVSNIGNADLTTVEMIRLLVTGTNEMVHLRFAEFNLVGNQWRRAEIIDTATGRAIDDSVFTLSVINYEDNLNYYRPEGVVPERDRTRPDEEIFRNEQSLNLVVQDLPVGDSRSGVKFLVRPLDIFNYSEMKLFIHGDLNDGLGSVSHSDGVNYSADVFFRFGGDSNNYYEYRQPVVPGWNEISIIFSELTAIKQARGDSINLVVRYPVPGNPDHYYVVKGNPSLTSVKYLQVGIFNRSGESFNIPISGEVWVNELRVIGADDSPGWAYSISSSLKFADLLNINFNMSQTSPSFHRIADRFGSRVDARNWSMNADLDVLKLLPISMPESNLKLNYSHTESVGKPVYVPGTDIRVDQAAQQLDNNPFDSLRTNRKTGKQLITESQSINISDTWAVPNIRLRIPSSHWLIRDTFNALTFGFSYNKTFVRNPTILSNRAWVWNAQMNYALNLSPDYFFNPVDVPVLGTVVGLFSDYNKVKVYYLPQSYSINVSSRRNKATSINRPQGTQPSNMQLSRDFTAQRSFGFNWKMTEGGFLNITTTYNFDVSSSLAYLETDATGAQRKESKIWSEIFTGAFFGKDYLFRQNLDIKTAPKLPSIWDLNRHFTFTAGYNVNYQWNNDFRQEELGRSAAFANKTSLGLTIRLKNLTAPLFAEENKNQKANEQVTRGRRTEGEPTVSDTLSQAADTTVEKGKALTNALLTLRSAVKYVFFDYDNITVNFSNDNNLGRGGIRGRGTGLRNFWGIGFDDDNGPSRLFMLGLSPNVGTRAANGNFTDNFRQGNNLDFRTSRPLWEGAKVDLNWKVGWSMNKSTTLRSDQFGNTSISSITSTGTLNRSFLSVPPVLIFSMFKNGIGKVNELYNPNAADPNAELSDAFIEGFETLPLLSKLGFLNEFSKYIPRPNWRLTWDGLEKFALFKSAKRVSLDHAYSSTYTEGWKITPDGSKETQTQRIEYGFAPLAGLNLSFGEVWGGNLNASLKYNARTSYDLGVSTRNITETFSRDIGITAGYQKSGFELPLFGLALKNDIEFSFSYTNTRNASVLYNMNQFTEAGIPQDGTTRTTMEPRIKYTISSKVTLAIFYRRSSQEPEGASRIPPTTTNEAGLDVHILIRP